MCLSFSRFWDRNGACTAAEGHRNNRYRYKTAATCEKKKRKKRAAACETDRNDACPPESCFLLARD